MIDCRNEPMKSSLIVHQIIDSSSPTTYGLKTYSGAVVFCPLKQHEPRKFGRYGLLELLRPTGSVPTLAGPLIRAKTRSRACSIRCNKRSTFQPARLPLEHTT